MMTKAIAKILTILITGSAILSTAACGESRPGMATQERLDQAKAISNYEEKKPIDANLVGNISGLVTFSGKSPRVTIINLSSDAVCAAAHSAPVKSASYVVSEDGELANVVVTIKKGLEAYNLPQEEIPNLNQKGCIYGPRVIIAQPGKVTIQSSDDTLHNVHSFSKKNAAFNVAMPGPGTLEKKFDRPEIIRLKCDVHAWMKAFIVVAETMGDVSKVDGNYMIEGLPVGEYEVEAWHEELGTKTATIKVEKDKTASLNFDFS
ncbi:MAG: hypothetical protein JKX97_00720 [Candidatus Lindowbacteria bacterium]|nr:hypothetical protein [Candidatus Lindowbacteria bacterium]